MRRRHRSQVAGVAGALTLLAVVLLVDVAGCAGVLGFPDRALDDQIGNEAGAGDDAPVIPPGLTFSAQEIDFGLTPCGGAAPAPKSVILSNGTTSAVEWTASISETTDFAISGPATGKVEPNTTAVIAISAVAVVATTEAGSSSQALLTITTNHPDKPKTDVPIKLTAGGATLKVTPQSVDFGEASIGIAAADIPVVLENTGNQPAQIAFAPLVDPQFIFTWTGAPAAVTVAPGATVLGLVGKFTPTKVASSTASTAITVSGGAVCGSNSATNISFSGKGSPSDAAVQPGTLDFGSVNCGTTAGAKTVTIVNSGNAAFTWTAVTPPKGMYVLSKTTGILAAKSNEQITVTPAAIPMPTETTSNLFGDTLTITTTAAADVPHVVDLRMTPQGAILAQSTALLDFSSVQLNTPEMAPFTVTNSGNAPADISYAVTDPAFVMAPSTTTLGGDASFAFNTTFTPLEQKTYAGTATISVDTATTVLCKPLPGAIALAGKGATSATLTSNVNFGLVGCGTQAAPRTVKLTNIGGSSFTWVATLGKAYYAISPMNGTLQAGGFQTITVTPITVPGTSSTLADFYADTLTIQTTPALESPYISSIHMTAKGAVLSFTPTTIAFGNVASPGGSKSKPLTVTNSGNLSADLTLTADSATADTFSITPTTKLLKSSFNPSVTFTPKSTGAKSGTISVTTPTTLCGPLPTPAALTGNGT